MSGTFVSNGAGARWSKASVFRAGRFPVIGRFALAGGKPYAADAVKTVRSLALQFSLPHGEEWRTGMNALPIFPVRTPEAFHEQLVAMAPDPATGKPDPAHASAFLAKYPETARALQRIQAEKPAPGFADNTYNSLNAFVLTDENGRSTPVRWSLVPESPPAENAQLPAMAGSAPPPEDKNSLFDALIARFERGPLSWHLVLTIGAPGDPTNDATVEWPAEREKVNVGTVILDHIESEATSPARTINFDPLVLPAGISSSDDPLLSARSAAYSVSFRRRFGEPVAPSAVTPAEISADDARTMNDEPAR